MLFQGTVELSFPFILAMPYPMATATTRSSVATFMMYECFLFNRRTNTEDQIPTVPHNATRRNC